MKKEETGRIIEDVSNPNIRAMKWLASAGAFMGAAVAVIATQFSLGVGEEAMPFTVIFLANVFLFAIAGVILWMHFSAREVVLYEKGMKLPDSMLSSQYVRYEDILSIEPYARGGKVKIGTKNGDIEVSKGFIGRWDEFISVLQKKGLVEKE